MIIYSVTVIIKLGIESSWLNWMKTEHINNVMATDHFKECVIQKLVIPEGSQGEVTYLVNYSLNELESYEKYAKNEASRLQNEHSDKFPGNFKVSRAVYEIIE